jgi:hypothetical protein
VFNFISEIMFNDDQKIFYSLESESYVI